MTAPGRRPPPPEFAGDWGHAPADMTRFTRIVLFALLAVVCGVVGFNLVFFPPIFLFGAVFGIAAVVAVLARPFLGLLLYAAIFVLRPAEIWPVLAVLRVERIVGAVTLVAMFMEMVRKEGRIRFDRSGVTGWLLLFLFGVYLSVPFSYWPGHTLGKVVELLKVIAFYVMIVHLVDTPRRLRAFAAVYILLMAWIGGSSLWSYLHGQLVFAQGIERAAGITSAGGDPNSLGATLGSAFPVAAFLAGRARRWPLRVGLLVTAALFVVTLAFTGSRSSVLGLLAVFGVLWWFSRNRLATGLAGVLLLAVVFVSLPDSYKDRYRSITSSELDGSSRFRLLTWQSGLRMFLDRPVTGVGAGAFSVANAEHYALDPEARWLESHSLYVQVPAEIGVVGAVTYFGFLVGATRLNRRLARRLERTRRDVAWERGLLDGLFAGMVFLFVFSIFGHTMFRFTWYVYAGLGVAAWRILRTRACPLIPRPPGAPAG